MRLLLGTHIFRWYTEGDWSICPLLLDNLALPPNKPMVSMASFLEIAIKLSINKLNIGKDFQLIYQQANQAKIEIIPIQPAHLNTLSTLPLMPNQKDPFDRLILATAIAMKLLLASIDNKFTIYKEYVDFIS